MNVEQCFPIPEFSVSEMQEIAGAFKHPAVVKYLKHLGRINAIKIAVNPKDNGMTDAEYINSQEQLRGGIAMVLTLLDVEEAPKEENSAPQGS